MRAVWAAPRRMRGARRRRVRGVARERGYGTVLSPLVPAELAGSVRAAREWTLASACAHAAQDLSPEDAHGAPGAAGRDVRPADARATSATLLALDAPELRSRLGLRPGDPRALPRERPDSRGAAMAADDRALGYVMTGRIARGGGHRQARRRPRRARAAGSGRRWSEDAVRGLALAGVPYVTLTTQADNAAAQRLYARLGFRTLRGELVGLTVSGVKEGR